MNLRLLLKCLWFFICILLPFSNTAQTCNGNTFSSPGVPATCTYSYTASGWEDQFGSPTSKPTSISGSESVCILANNSDNLSFNFYGTFYVAPGVTFSGSVNSFRDATLVIEGIASFSNDPGFRDVTTYVHPTGEINISGDMTTENTSFLYNAGLINVGGSLALGGGSDNYIYPNASLIVQGNLNVNSPMSNCGLLEVVTGQLSAGGGSSLTNLCTTYVHNTFKLNNNYTNEGLLIVDGTFDFNNKNITNENTMIVEDIILSASNLVGNYYSSILIVRDRAQLRNGASITGHYYFDINNGGGFDAVCGSCVEDIIILDNVVVPSDPALLKADCGINIVLDFPFCKTVEDDNTIYGSAFNDYNRNGAYDAGEPLEGNVTVNLYSDLNSNGIIDGADSVIQTTVTNLNGEYTFGVTPTITFNQIFTNRVDRLSDDAQQEGNASVVISSDEYKFKIGDPFVGIRINDINIPRRSKIKEAKISFFSKDDQTGFLSYEISGQKIDNAQTFVEVNNNLSNRWDDNNKVSWFNMIDWSENTVYDTPDMSSIIRDIISRYGWESNNSMAFIFRHFDGPNAERKAVSYEKDNATAAQLEIKYDAAVPASYIVQIDLATIPAGSSLTTPSNYAVSFTSVNEITCNNDFGFSSPCSDPAGTDTDGDGVNNECDLDDDNDGILDVDECADLAKERILNSDFEYVNIVSSGLDQGPTDAAGSYIGVWKGDTSHLPNWESVHSNNILEIWQNGHSPTLDPGGTAYSGIQWTEVNISTNDGLYQDITTTPGDLLQWSFAHRKRTTYAGGADDVVDLLIGDPSGSMVSQGNFTSANNSSWTLHSGTYTVPVGQTTTRLQFTAISTASGSPVSGNYVDAVQFYVIPNCENTDGDAYEDYLDIDSDDDGIPDNIEAQATIGYLPPVGPVNSSSGLYPDYSSGLSLVDSDGDGIYDFRDLNSDNDATPDIEENGMANIAGPSDTDADGLNDAFETNGVSDVSWDVNEDISDPTDLSILPDLDDDRLIGGDLDYRDLLDGNLPSLAKIDFDGVDDYIELKKGSPINTLDEFTLSFWGKLDEVLTAPFPAKTFVIGQKEMFEVNVGLNASGDPSLWTTHYYGPGPSSQTVEHPIDNINWFHYTAVVNYITESILVYINGEPVSGLDISGNSRLTNTNPFRMGSKLEIQPDPDYQNFKGWIDELRIFNSSLTASQIQQMTYQEIENNSGILHGSIIDKDILDPSAKAIPWYNLICYHPMNFIVRGDLLDSSLYGNDGRLYNILSVEPQNAPLPYETQADGSWTTEGTWLHGSVWDIEDIPNNKDWSVVHIHDNITTNASHSQSGMFIDTGKTLTVSGDNSVTNNWYLQLDGTLDLADDSQLVQTSTSDLVTSATGKILRRQEGNANYLWYNYWASPVGALGATSLNDNNATVNNPNNTPFALNMIKDGNGNPLGFTTAFNEMGKISSRWLHTFDDGVTYFDWVNIDENTTINSGVGYTQKGTGVDSNPDPLITEQQYIFEGKPNNGTILINSIDTGGPGSLEGSSLTTSLVGNPYPSAIDSRTFITDNSGVIGGTILLWEQWAGSSHFLSAYEGGYGFITILTTERGYQYPGIPISGQVQTEGIKRPTFYLPVGQGFFVQVESDGDIEFNNGQRVFIKENDVMTDQGDTNYATNGSSFMRTSNTDNTESLGSTEETTAETQILRLEFGVSSGASRSFVLGFTEDATDGYDYGLDGGLINNPPADDMGSLLNGEQYVIQAFAPYTSDKEIDLVLHASGNFTYTLESTEITNFPEGQELFLKDLLTGQNYDLRSTEPYNFTSVAGSFTGRFQVVFQDPAALSTEDFTNDNTLIYVNQPEDKLYVKQMTDQAKELSVSNMLGQRIKHMNSINNQTLENGIDVSGLSSGVYIISIKTENDQSIDKKVIIN